jgi:hypothetical protein
LDEASVSTTLRSVTANSLRSGSGGASAATRAAEYAGGLEKLSQAFAGTLQRAAMNEAVRHEAHAQTSTAWSGGDEQPMIDRHCRRI